MLLPVEDYVNHPTIIHAWDNTPRSGANGQVIHDADPELYRCCLRKAIELSNLHPPGENIVFMPSLGTNGRKVTTWNLIFAMGMHFCRWSSRKLPCLRGC